MPGSRLFRESSKPLAALVAVLVIFVAVERLHWFGHLRALAGPRLTWIWERSSPREVRPRIFLAVRDFDLTSALTRANLSVLGDAEYVVYLNGHRVGSNSYFESAPLDVYAVGPLLHAGSNRVILELRSPIGSGAATLRIDGPDGRALVTTDGQWRIFDRYLPALFAGGKLWGRPNAEVLGESPLGRWGTPRRGPEKPTFAEATTLRHADVALAFRRPKTGPAWTPLRRRPPRHGHGLGRLVEFDFGREVEGYLHLSFVPGPERAALVHFGSRPSEHLGWTPEAIVIPLAGRRFWQDSRPRRFRYVEVAGLDGVTWAAVLPLRPRAWALLGPRPQELGVFALGAPAVRLPVVDDVWKRFLENPIEAAAPPLAAAPGPLRRDAAARKSEHPRGRHGRRRREDR